MEALPWMALNTFGRDRSREAAAARLRVVPGQGIWAWLVLGPAIYLWAVELLHPCRQPRAPSGDIQS